MKKFIAAFLLLCACAVLGSQVEAAKKDPTDDLLRSRAAVVWIGGKRIGDLMVGADAKLYFQLIDRTLSERIYSDPTSFPDDILWNASYIDKAARAKCNLIILVYKALVPWIFDPAKITVNGEPIDKRRVYSSLLAIPTGKIASDTEDVIAFGVPRALCKPGSKLVFGYGDYKDELIVPGKK